MTRKHQTTRSCEWDIDRYEELQDVAWELDSRASEQDRNTRSSGQLPDGGANREAASAARQEAAHLLSQFWVLPHPIG